jgi:quercetin dioxygenase-like cupin family protein
MRAPLLSIGMLLCAVALHAQGASAHKSALSWGPAPAVFPKGAKMAVVRGDPSKAEEFTVELSFPNGYKIPPHFHSAEESVTVKKGTLLVGMGDTLDLSKTKAIKAGKKGSLPAQQHHYAAARGATVISIKSKGPFDMTYVNPADNPEKAGQ